MSVWSEPPGGFTPEQLQGRRRRGIQALAVVLVVVMVSIAGAGSYRWVTRVRPVDRSHAVALFRATRAQPPAVERRTQTGRQASARTRVSSEPGMHWRRTRSHTVETKRPRATKPLPDVGEGPKGNSEPQDRDRGGPSFEPSPPQEGVYSWATDGYEQVGGARRAFPAETQRIITRERGHTWTQHHYFSEDRQIWTSFQRGSRGVEIARQRNEVTFGPVTNESEIDFRPPMLAAPDSLRIGTRWQGRWDGDTYGDYSGEVLERTWMRIAGQRVEAWRMTYVINLRGEQQGRVEAEVWFAPGPALTVKEHYVQDVESGAARYHAEWVQTLKSLQPRQ